jgi:hypothetical protein
LNDIEYNFNRPRQSFDYLAPGVYIEKEVTKIRSPVLPVWSAGTKTRQRQKGVIAGHRQKETEQS